MVYRPTDQRRKRGGTILPLLAVCMIGLFGFCGLAIDLGLLAVSRTQSQNAADTGALTACRLLNGKVGSVNSNLGPAVTEGKLRITTNNLLNKNFTTAQISKVEAGQYLYNATSQTFAVYNGQGTAPANLGWADTATNPTPSAGQWTAIRTTIAVSQPTFFMRVFGVTGMPTGAKATAVFKPRDVAFVLDMTGSMAYSSQFNFNGTSRNPDTMVPAFAHYPNTYSNIVATANAYDSSASNQVMSMNNHTISTPGGPPIVRGFYFDKRNASTPGTSIYPVDPSKLLNAFHRWSPTESGGNSSTYTGVTYDFTGYNAMHVGTETPPKGPTPAPTNFGTMTDTPITYVGDRYRRADGSINKIDTTWATGAPTTKAAATVYELLGYGYSSPNILRSPGGATIVAATQFRDYVWEKYGYDMDIKQYRTDRAGGLPLKMNYVPTMLPAADQFKGYSMGPGYWGKTFFIWPPDPRTPVNDPGQAGYIPGDWRQRYFDKADGSSMDPQADNNTTDGGAAGNIQGINEVLLKTGSGLTLASGTTTFKPDYAKILKWIKSGPQVLPANLRAGRVLYYSSIPDDVDTTSTPITSQIGMDKVFWRNYINYVLGYGRTSASNATELYGNSDSWSGATVSVNASDMASWTGPWTPTEIWPDQKPTMHYADSPLRPRLHLWFGPLSMMDFMGNGTAASGSTTTNWLPGTVNEAQCWQLKAGMNSVLDDVKNNHPNNYVGMVMFAYSDYNDIRRPMGQNFQSLKNALFYPKTLLDLIDSGDTTTEIRPYTVTNSTTLSNLKADIIPNANQSTDPITGFAYAFNLMSPSSSLPSQYTSKGRRGAAKTVIFETDGVPNSSRSFTPTLAGYNTYYPTSGSTKGYAQSDAIAIIDQMVKPMLATTTGDSGMSLPNALCRVYPIGFGDLFDADLAPGATTARNNATAFFNAVAAAGKTGSVPSSQIITGEYQERIAGLKSCMENIFQSGVGVTLVE